MNKLDLFINSDFMNYSFIPSHLEIDFYYFYYY
jgi:hypothetical protein